ncbi:MAG TPA: type II toxin-antitoxin system RelE/ParE family toxin [Patescibacteria group bacterium]|nr:type II toxin-antitoxin system RelE/ParE family toxin [Patescibacteria group bacterium]
MASVEISTAAEADLIDIWIHVAADDSAAADRQLDHFDRVFALLATQPLMGIDRSDLLQSGIRSLVVDRYLVFYSLTTKPRILRVLHGARDWTAILDGAETTQE